jgi:chemotaxis family two-component system response regulator Rcp1
MVEILLIEDNPGDVRLTREALNNGRVLNNLHVVEDGQQAMAFLRRWPGFEDAPTPDLIIMDLHLPGKDGQTLLKEIKADRKLRRIPVVILTTSEAKDDILKAYEAQASCYVTKPVDLDQFLNIVRSIEDFWFKIVKLP